MSSQGTRSEPVDVSDKELERYRWRYRQARRAGMEWGHAKIFAASDLDIEEMRRLARKGCPPDMLLELL